MDTQQTSNRSIFEPLKIAASLLTRWPVKIAIPVNQTDQGKSVAYYPLVGLLIGALLYTCAYAATTLLPNANPLLLAVILVSIWVAITGALHLDGLADSADAWLGGYGDRARTLAIMKDPACGPAGVIALVLVLLGKTAALTALLSNLGSDLDSNLPTNANELTAITHASALLPLLIAPLLGRAACSALFLILPYVRENGIGHSAAQTFNQRLTQTPTQIALIISIALTLLCGQWLMLLVAIVVLLTGIYMMRQRLGGFTGDTAGALVEVVEVMGLIGATL
jgi:adenosylcobinamide-GDP ribazoletransferase